jgi:hypothetical protein
MQFMFKFIQRTTGLKSSHTGGAHVGSNDQESFYSLSVNVFLLIGAKTWGGLRSKATLAKFAESTFATLRQGCFTNRLSKLHIRLFQHKIGSLTFHSDSSNKNDGTLKPKNAVGTFECIFPGCSAEWLENSYGCSISPVQARVNLLGSMLIFLCHIVSSADPKYKCHVCPRSFRTSPPPLAHEKGVQ